MTEEERADEQARARRIAEAAARALSEAATRRANAKPNDSSVVEERGGPRGPEPTRYGDWEVKGVVSDF